MYNSNPTFIAGRVLVEGGEDCEQCISYFVHEVEALVSKFQDAFEEKDKVQEERKASPWLNKLKNELGLPRNERD